MSQSNPNTDGSDGWATKAEPTEPGQSQGMPDQHDHPQRPDYNPDRDTPRHDDWWGEPEVESPKHGTDWSDEEFQDEKAQQATRLVLHGIAPKLCGASIDDPALTPTELTEPQVYPHGEGNRSHLRQARVNETHGMISGGESTGVRLGDVGSETFFEIVEILLGYWQVCGHIDSSDVEEFMIDARKMHQKPDIGDAEAIERLAKDALVRSDN